MFPFTNKRKCQERDDHTESHLMMPTASSEGRLSFSIFDVFCPTYIEIPFDDVIKYKYENWRLKLQVDNYTFCICVAFDKIFIVNEENFDADVCTTIKIDGEYLLKLVNNKTTLLSAYKNKNKNKKIQVNPLVTEYYSEKNDIDKILKFLDIIYFQKKYTDPDLKGSMLSFQQSQINIYIDSISKILASGKGDHSVIAYIFDAKLLDADSYEDIRKLLADNIFSLGGEDGVVKFIDGYGYASDLDAAINFLNILLELTSDINVLIDNAKEITERIESDHVPLTKMLASSGIKDDWGDVDETAKFKIAANFMKKRFGVDLKSNLACHVLASYIETSLSTMHEDNSAIDEDASGLEYEVFLVNRLRSSGFDASLTKQSGDQGVDILIESDHMNIAIQAKYYSSNIGNSAVQEAYSGMGYYGAQIAMVVTNSSYTKSAKELASTLNVLLCHHDDMVEVVTSLIGSDDDTVMNELLKLHSLLEKGVITEEEFETLKAK